MTPTPSATVTTSAAPSLNRLTIIYDERCEVCRRCRAWLEGQEQLVPLVFAAAGDPAVVAWAGGAIPVGGELVVVADDGATWVGPDAFIVCLWALRSHRRTSRRLQNPALRPVARQLLHALSAGRGIASAVLSESSAVAGEISAAGGGSFAGEGSLAGGGSGDCSDEGCRP